MFGFTYIYIVVCGEKDFILRQVKCYCIHTAHSNFVEIREE